MAQVGLMLLLAGKGTRFGGALPKQFQFFNQPEPLFAQTVTHLLQGLPIKQVVLVVKEAYFSEPTFREGYNRVQKRYPQIQWDAVAGGETRHLSFRAGWKALKKGRSNAKNIVVHDANRPTLPREFLTRIKGELDSLSYERPAAVPVVPVSDSLAYLNDDLVSSYLPRTRLAHLQTPQVFWAPAIEEALSTEAAQEENYSDEGSFLLHAGYPVRHFEGDWANRKITHSGDHP